MAESKRDYYEVLGVQKGCTDDELKKAYPSFDVKQYGFSRISSFIRSFGTFRIRDNMVQLK